MPVDGVLEWVSSSDEGDLPVLGDAGVRVVHLVHRHPALHDLEGGVVALALHLGVQLEARLDGRVGELLGLAVRSERVVVLLDQDLGDVGVEALREALGELVALVLCGLDGLALAVHAPARHLLVLAARLGPSQQELLDGLADVPLAVRDVVLAHVLGVSLCVARLGRVGLERLGHEPVQHHEAPSVRDAVVRLRVQVLGLEDVEDGVELVVPDLVEGERQRWRHAPPLRVREAQVRVRGHGGLRLVHGEDVCGERLLVRRLWAEATVVGEAVGGVGGRGELVGSPLQRAPRAVVHDRAVALGAARVVLPCVVRVLLLLDQLVLELQLLRAPLERARVGLEPLQLNYLYSLHVDLGLAHLDGLVEQLHAFLRYGDVLDGRLRLLLVLMHFFSPPGAALAVCGDHALEAGGDSLVRDHDALGLFHLPAHGGLVGEDELELGLRAEHGDDDVALCGRVGPAVVAA